MAAASAGEGGTISPNSSSIARRRELEDPLNLHFFHPLAHRLALVLRPTGISPNAVSVASGLFVVAAAWAYTGLGWPRSVLLGFAFHMLWHVLDGADGDLARMTGRSSPAGELIDGVADYAGHIILYIALAAFLDDWIHGWAWLLASLSGASRIAQSNHIETQRRVYLWRIYAVPWLKQAQSSGDALFRRKGPVAAIFVGFARIYIMLAGAMSPRTGEIDAAIAAASGDPGEARRLRRLCRQSARSSLVYQHLLGANPRTLLLGISMAIGSPLYFFVVETVLLNLVLILSIRHQARCDRRLMARL
jgi:phosphatidylglycerophosphate synthase